jgi:hypothetical protein
MHVFAENPEMGNTRSTRELATSTSWADVYDPGENTGPEDSLNGYLHSDKSVIPVELLEVIFMECSEEDILNVAQVCLVLCYL